MFDSRGLTVKTGISMYKNFLNYPKKFLSDVGPATIGPLIGSVRKDFVDEMAFSWTLK